uniref:Uncharacterized protein n=1 Tax=Chromera velia CCMP2878 TaxID=1169474 RepID=A0A0G4FVL5_9ALVE|eukprot:Cvel_18848.t1-p1 / transcript=Cvel_18848.t1 / gene=Cvel_18848 / organism=Chromera_velia_CCMP2878 / gene_product=hypothetical protein / transcript_product=hypothetical protein / location=Cvel_scaffold1584:41481-42008(+) / protein_length=176 / sequence_SO=supercontig / SO=protein_coding / is_pseudo=false
MQAAEFLVPRIAVVSLDDSTSRPAASGTLGSETRSVVFPYCGWVLSVALVLRTGLGLMGARRHFLPRVEASRWVATQGAAKTRGSARICSGGEEEVGGAGLEWKLKASVLSRLCLNVDVCNQHIGSRPAPRFHEEGSHELTGEDVDQGADSGRRAQVVLDEQELPDWRDVDETGPL